MENLILVIYVGVQGVRSEDIPEFIEKIAKQLTPSTLEGEIIVIPTQSIDTKIECINPKFIIDVKLIEEHNIMMKKLNIELQHQLKKLKEVNNE